MNSEPTGDFRKVTLADADYPQSLRELTDRPEVLYIQGRWPLPESCRIGIVGTRHPTIYGMQVTERFTLDLVSRGVTTVSGLAAGIDACAHRATLLEGGWTIAVLGHGFKYVYPRENKLLFDEIRKRGTLVTEFSYDTEPLATHFPQRNRIISGLSQGVLVVEAAKRSGASITARYAAEQGRDVFVVPGSVYNPQSQGCHRLIKEGARLVESAEEILEEYGLSTPISSPPHVRRTMDPLPVAAGDDTKRDEGLSSQEKEILKMMSAVPVSIDELVELSKMPVDRLAEVLLSLELKERIQAMPGQQYASNI
jgi:DNA processing protein